MFKKIVSNLPFSPTLISELGFYAKRLSKEEAARKTGLILTALALVVQSLIVFSPPESANAAGPSDIVRGGLHTRTQLVEAWDKNTQGWRDLMQHAGITRAQLASAKSGEINTRTKGADNGWITWGRVSRGGTSYGETAFKVGDQTIYSRLLASYDTGKNRTGYGSYYPSFLLKNSRGEDVIIIKACANIVMKKRPKSNASIQVCNLADRKIITIRESQFNASLHSKNISDCQPKPIKVCDLGSKQIITVDEKDFDAKKHSKNLEDCKEKPVPVASCSSLVIKKISRTEVELQASASTANGATVSGYTYIIKDKEGKEVARKEIKTTSLTNSQRFSVDKDGNYTASVTVSTSLGSRTDDACQGEFVVSPIERCPINPSLPINHPDCQPCPGDPTIWFKDENCAAKVLRSKSAKNLTSGSSAEETIAKASDRIEYVLTAKNEGKDSATFNLEDDISDVLEYSSLYDRGGATLDEQTKVLSWGEVTLKPGEEQKRTYVVQMASKISPMARGTSDPTSYDCKMTNVFGNTIEVKVDCPTPKIIEQTVPELPRTGPGENMIVGGIVAAVVTFLYLRSRQLNKEVRLIRREVTAGTI